MWFDCKLMKEMQGKSILVCVNTRFKSRGGGGGVGGCGSRYQESTVFLFVYIFIYNYFVLNSPPHL